MFLAEIPFSRANEESTLLVENLPTTTTKDQLLDYFLPFGLIMDIRLRTEADEPLRDESQRLRDLSLKAYVIFTNHKPRENAMVSEKPFHGRTITMRRPVHHLTELVRSVCVGNLADTVTIEDLREVFEASEGVTKVMDVHMEPGPKGAPVAIVRLRNKVCRNKAMKLHGTWLKGKPMFLESCQAQRKFQNRQRHNQKVFEKQQKKAMRLSMMKKPANGKKMTLKKAKETKNVKVSKRQVHGRPHNFNQEKMRWVNPNMKQ